MIIALYQFNIYLYKLATTTENMYISLKPFRRNHYINIIII